MSLPRYPKQTLPAPSYHRNVLVERKRCSIEANSMPGKSNGAEALFFFSLILSSGFLDLSLSPFSNGIEASIPVSLHPDSNLDAPEGSLARRGGSARLCGLIVVVDVKADAAAAVVGLFCLLDDALPPSSRAVRTAPPPPQLTEEDNMPSHSCAPRGARKKLRGNGKRGREGWERILSLRSCKRARERAEVIFSSSVVH